MNAAAWISVGCVEYSALNCWIPSRQRLQVGLAGQIEQGHQEVVPGEEEVEQADGGDGRDGLRDDDRAQDPERAGPVDHRGLVELARDRHEVLAEQEDVVGVREEVRDDQGQPRSVPAEPGEDHVGRQQRHLERQDDRGDQDDEEGVAPREPEPGEAVGHQDRREDRAERAQDGDPDGVPQQEREVHLVPRLGVVLDERVELPGLLQGPPAADPFECRRRRVVRVDDDARLATLLDQHELFRGAVRERDRVDRDTARPGRCRSGAMPDRSARPAWRLWPGCCSAVVTMYSIGSRSVEMMSSANIVIDALPRNLR